jgi:uncharacterized protein YgbK (DUF1537 family)
MNQDYPTYQQLVGRLQPPELPFTDAGLSAKITRAQDAIIVLDDDPTGTQTVHDIPVLTEWSVEAIGAELERGSPLFYVLTNSRSLTPEAARTLALEIADNIRQAAENSGKKCLPISRSDSTLRGHYPLEVEVLTQVLQPEKAVHFLVPAFFEGGRYTIGDVHYVREGEQMIPAAETPFAQDKVFGYRSSDLREWVREKFAGKIEPANIHALSIDDLENRPVEALISRINTFQANDVCIVNAAHYDHLKLALNVILSSSVNPFFRSAASLVAALAGQSPKFVDARTLELKATRGGICVLGSYVPKSTQQLAHVLDSLDIESIEVNVSALLKGEEPAALAVAASIDEHISRGRDVILYTSRELVSTEDAAQNLEIGATVSSYLTDIVSALSSSPRYIIGKGGITSSDLATRSLRIKRAMVLGQIIPGVPVWQALAGSKFPGTPFVVFPGNVGDHTGLTRVIQQLQP